MELTPLPLKLQGLWLGAAAGELYAGGKLNPTVVLTETLTVQNHLPQLDRLCIFTARLLKLAHLFQPDQLETTLLQYRTWQELLPNLLPLYFLHPLGAQGLQQALVDVARASQQPELFASAIALVKFLDWLQFQGAQRQLQPALAQHPALQGTQVLAACTQMFQRLDTHQMLPGQQESTPHATSSNPCPSAQVVAQILYLLLSAPAELRLAVQRSALTFPADPAGVLLTAALSGFRNGASALPLDWRYVLQSVRWSVPISLDTSLCRLGNLCAARWAGVYVDDPAQDWSTVAIATAGQLRPR